MSGLPWFCLLLLSLSCLASTSAFFFRSYEDYSGLPARAQSWKRTNGPVQGSWYYIMGHGGNRKRTETKRTVFYDSDDLDLDNRKWLLEKILSASSIPDGTEPRGLDEEVSKPF